MFKDGNILNTKQFIKGNGQVFFCVTPKNLALHEPSFHFPE